MKLVWLVNVILPQIAITQGKNKQVIVGWVVQLADIMARDPDIDFTVFYPQSESRDNIVGSAGDIKYVGFYENAIPELSYNPEMTGRMKTELNRIRPDIVHIWGSEFIHTLSMVRAFNRPERTVISIQGLIHMIGSVYESGLPEKIVKRNTFRDFIRRDSIERQKEKFLKRGDCEIEALKEVKHVIGRTEWDRKAVLEINPKLSYHHAGEILREEFYNKKKIWSLEEAEDYRIFMTQSYYPIKGIHFAIEALSEVKKTFPGVKLSVTGKDMRPLTLKDRLKQDSYGKYICDLIREKDLEENIEFLGTMDVEQMIEQYLRCSVFLLPSVMENSSNSLGEAMMLGVPCIVAATGGTPYMINNDEGWLYDYNDTDELERLLVSVLREADEVRIGNNSLFFNKQERARKHSMESYDVMLNHKAYIRAYESIINKDCGDME